MSSRPSEFPLTLPGSLRLYSLPDLLRLPPPRWQIDQILPAGSFAVLYSEPESYKTFAALDMALSIATGLPWNGHNTEQGHALYISAEGGGGIAKRAHAWCLQRGVDPRKPWVAFLIEALFIHNESDGLERLHDRVLNEAQIEPDLVVVDTLARCFDGDENQQEDMGRFISGIDTIRRTFHATVLAVHHTNLGGFRERGNTSLRGAADTMLRLDREGEGLTITCTKQKDAEHFDEMRQRFVSVAGTESGCLVPEVDPAIERQRKVLEILKENGPLTFELWAHAVGSTGIPESTFKRILVSLRQSGAITKVNGQWEARRLTSEKAVSPS